MKQLLTLALIVWLCLALPPVTARGIEAGTPPPSGSGWPDLLAGSWHSDCTAFGKTAKCRYDWRPGLHDHLLTVTYRVEEASTARPLFSGDGVYRIEGSALTGYWSDSNGALHPLEGTWDGRTLTVLWGTPQTQRGRTVYRLLGDGHLRIEDAILRDDAWTGFMSADYHRVK